MNIDEAIERACQEPTITDAIAWICEWEGQRAIEQAIEYAKTGVRTGSDGKAWDTCFKHCIQRVYKEYVARSMRKMLSITPLYDQDKVAAFTACARAAFDPHS